MHASGWSPGRRGGLLLALTAVAVGLVLLVVALRGQESAPRPKPAGGIDPGSQRSAQASSPQGESQAPTAGTAQRGPLGPSRPVSLRIPGIGVDTQVLPIGLAADGTLAVPQPGPHLNDAAWFENSPTPGQPGPSIIEGHVDSVAGPSVFFKLGAIKPGDQIIVRRLDGRVLTFEVNAVRDFLKNKFPTHLVYGGTTHQLSIPTLRLITCSDFDATIGHHVGNEVVFAHLTHVSGGS